MKSFRFVEINLSIHPSMVQLLERREPAAPHRDEEIDVESSPRSTAIARQPFKGASYKPSCCYNDIITIRLSYPSGNFFKSSVFLKKT